MRRCRGLSVAILAVAGLAVPLWAQEGPRTSPLALLHHEGSLPNYLSAIQPSLEGWLSRTLAGPPSRPRAVALIAPLHHDGAPPDYLNAIEPRGAHGIMSPRPPTSPPPAAVRGLYLNAWLFGSSRLERLIRLADTTEINAFVIDVKDATGYLTYPSTIATAIEINANGQIRAPDTGARIARLRARGIHPIARIVVARDPLLAQGKRGWAIRDVGGGLWRDGLGKPWVDAHNDSVWVYAAEIAREAVELGFAEIQFDYVRFPDEPPHRLNRAVYPAKREGETARTSLVRHLKLLRDRVQPLGVPFTVDVFGLTTSTEGGLGIGQNWEDLIQVADVVLPMVYPSHYRRGSYGLPHPNSQPYTVVRRALQDGVRRAAVVPEAARIRPYLQAFTLGRPRYTAAEVRAQIAAVEDTGLSEWILWNARGVYPARALRRHPVVAGSALSAEAFGEPLR